MLTASSFLRTNRFRTEAPTDGVDVVGAGLPHGSCPRDPQDELVTKKYPQPGGAPPVEQFPTRLLLVRHGRSADRTDDDGLGEDPPLHEMGHQQALALAERLRVARLVAAYASPLERAYRTAVYTAEHHGLEVRTDPDLVEVDLGHWSNGLYRRLAAEQAPEFMVHIRTGRWDDVPGSEGDDALRRRVTTAIDRIVDAGHIGNVLVSCHSGVINAYLAGLLGLESRRVAVIENTSISVVYAGPGGRVIGSVNDHVHLGDPHAI